MPRYAALATGVLGFFLGLYLLVEALDVRLLTDPSPWLDDATVPTALLGIALLVADAFLPVPSSLVMVAHGALFGVVAGAVLSLVGRVGFTLVGFAAGRRGGALVDRVLVDEARASADRLLERFGALAIVLSRPVPLLAETVAVLAGASRLSSRRVTAAALVGSLPEAVLYALAGAVAASFRNAALVFLLVLLAAAVFWLLLRRLEGRVATATPAPRAPR